MTRLLVMSVYAPDTWHLLQYQQWFLARTTVDYEFVVVSKQQPPLGCMWLKCSGTTHTHGLDAIREYVASAKQFESACVLDSDAFPVRRDWQDTLDNGLRQFDKRFAAPMRLENGDMFPHISFVYSSRKEFGKVGQKFRRGRGRRIDGSRSDIGAGMSSDACLYLLKSNRWSPSQVLHTIYGDIIYHRAASTWNATSAAPLVKGRRYWQSLTNMVSLPGCEKQPPTPEYINRLVGEERFSMADWV